MKKLSVNFRSGSDVLKSYWGYLSDGGLVLDQPDLREGQPITLNLIIEQSHMAQSLSGRVVRQNPARHQSVVRLAPGDSGRLLKVALADAPVDVTVDLEDVDAESGHQKVRLLNLSETGCCVQVDSAEAFPVGTEVELGGPGFDIAGCVVWALENDRGVIFSTDDNPNGRGQLQLFLRSLR